MMARFISFPVFNMGDPDVVPGSCRGLKYGPVDEINLSVSFPPLRWTNFFFNFKKNCWITIVRNVLYVWNQTFSTPHPHFTQEKACQTVSWSCFALQASCSHICNSKTLKKSSIGAPWFIHAFREPHILTHCHITVHDAPHPLGLWKWQITRSQEHYSQNCPQTYRIQGIFMPARYNLTTF